MRSKGISEGARLVTGGADMPEGLSKGNYVKPTVFADVTNDMVIAQEEIFGPVLAIIKYATIDDLTNTNTQLNYASKSRSSPGSL